MRSQREDINNLKNELGDIKGLLKELIEKTHG